MNACKQCGSAPCEEWCGAEDYSRITFDPSSSSGVRYLVPPRAKVPTKRSQLSSGALDMMAELMIRDFGHDYDAARKHLRRLMWTNRADVNAIIARMRRRLRGG